MRAQSLLRLSSFHLATPGPVVAQSHPQLTPELEVAVVRHACLLRGLLYAVVLSASLPTSLTRTTSLPGRRLRQGAGPPEPRGAVRAAGAGGHAGGPAQRVRAAGGEPGPGPAQRRLPAQPAARAPGARPRTAQLRPCTKSLLTVVFVFPVLPAWQSHDYCTTPFCMCFACSHCGRTQAVLRTFSECCSASAAGALKHCHPAAGARHA